MTVPESSQEKREEVVRTEELRRGDDRKRDT